LSASVSETLVGCGAVKKLDAHHGEIKSMRTPQTIRRVGVGRSMFAHIIAIARARGYQRLAWLKSVGFRVTLAYQSLPQEFGIIAYGRGGDAGYPFSTAVWARVGCVSFVSSDAAPETDRRAHCKESADQRGREGNHSSHFVESVPT